MVMINFPVDDIEHYFLALQKKLCSGLEITDGGATFVDDIWTRTNSKGITRVLTKGNVFEQAGVNFSYVRGEELPQAATSRKPELIGCPFQAMGVSVVIHPLNPYVPTSHMNIRFFLAKPYNTKPHWWFGGGFDLTPIYGFTEDAIHWHEVAKQACQHFGADLYPRFKKACDNYFRIKHRKEQRGIGGIFFDDFNEKSFRDTFGFTRSIGDHFLPAYLPIVERRRHKEFGDHERAFQLFRRGRYVEFNLVHDRGTRFGLESGGRAKSILISLPPMAAWHYEWPISNRDGPEESLTREFLQPKDWLGSE